MTLPRLGLQGKILLIMSLAVVTVVGVSTTIAMVLTSQLVAEEIYRKALSTAKAMAHQLVNQHTLENPPALLTELRQMERDFSSVKQADVYLHDPAHSLVVTTVPAGQHLELDDIPGIQQYNEYEQPDEDQITIETPNGKFWIVGTTVRDQGRSVACLNLKVSKSPLNALTGSLVLRNVLLTLASLAALALIIHVFFLRHVRAPVREMVRVMKSAESGSLAVRAEAASRDEIGDLALHLNRMLERIENFNTELNRQVEDATAELARRNEELKGINEELFETQKTLARSERLAIAGQLAAALAHEIGTPLNSISGHVQLLSRQKAGDEAAARRLQIIERQIESIVRTVKQLLSWTRKFELHFQPVDLRHLLEESLLLSSLALQHRRIRVETELDKACPPVTGDAGYLQQVFLNLINNSLDAMPRGGCLRVRLRAASSGSREVVIEFEDTGTGIPPEAVARIFEPMFTTKRFGAGAGLGLAICDQIIRQHGGTIRVASQPGQGTCFTLVLALEGPKKVAKETELREAALNLLA